MDKKKIQERVRLLQSIPSGICDCSIPCGQRAKDQSCHNQDCWHLRITAELPTIEQKLLAIAYNKKGKERRAN